MGRYAVKSNANDGTIRSLASDYGSARAGTALAVNDISTTLTGAGQFFDGSNIIIRQGFLEYTHTPPPATELVTSAAIVVEGFDHLPTGFIWDLEVRERDWGGALDTGDWLAGALITSDAPNLLAHYPQIRDARPAPVWWRSGIAALRTRVTGAAPLRVMWNSNKQAIGIGVGATVGVDNDEYVHFGTFEGGLYRPRLEYSTARLSSLTRVGSASAQLSDGTHVYLDADTPGAVSLKHNPSGVTYNTIAALSIGANVDQFALRDGVSVLTVVVDASDNIYVIGPNGSAVGRSVAIQSFAKGVGYTWTSKPVDYAELAYYDEGINQVAAAWHATSGAGHLVIVAGHAQGHILANQMLAATVSCAAVLDASTSGLAAVDSADITSDYYGAPVNAVGGGMDVLAMTSTVGFIGGLTSDRYNGEADTRPRLYRYVLTTGGSFAADPVAVTTPTTTFLADGDVTARLVPISATRFALFACGYFYVFSLSGSTATLTASSGGLHLQGMATVGASPYQPWDAVYDASTGKVRVYYLDTANSRRLMRTGYNPTTNLWDLVATEVATNLGAGGSTHNALRVPHALTDERRVLIHLGNVTGGGVRSTVTVADTSGNAAPNAPALTNPGTFNAGAAKAFTWAFSDANTRDAQSAYEVEIRNAATLVSAYASGKTLSATSGFTLAASTLSNTTNYEWRVRVYDAGDTVSAWSAWQAFATIATGVTLITDPVADNPALASPRLTITWTYTASGGLTQASYRVRVYRTDSGAQVFDSGSIFGPTVRAYEIVGLLSGVQQRIDLTVTDNMGTVSSTASRLVTPQFSAPDAPVITAVPTAESSGVLVTVANPTPTGFLPAAGRNDIYRTAAGLASWIKIGEAAANGSYIDYAAASGVLYDYRAYAVADGAAASNIVEDVSITFLGIFLHDPDSPTETLRQYLYGGADKAEDLESQAEPMRFVGRRYPVYEFGEQSDERIKATLVVPFGESWAQDWEYLREVVRSAKTWCYRDGRGRKIFGVIPSLSVQDTRMGTGVDLDVTRVEYDETLPS